MSACHVDTLARCRDNEKIQGEKIMSALNILIGGESFREIRERNCYYVDKTDLLEELLTAVPPKLLSSRVLVDSVRR